MVKSQKVVLVGLWSLAIAVLVVLGLKEFHKPIAPLPESAPPAQKITIDPADKAVAVRVNMTICDVKIFSQPGERSVKLVNSGERHRMIKTGSSVVVLSPGSQAVIKVASDRAKVLIESLTGDPPCTAAYSITN